MYKTGGEFKYKTSHSTLQSEVGRKAVPVYNGQWRSCIYSIRGHAMACTSV